MDDGRWTMEDGRWKMEDGRWKMDDGRQRTDAGCSMLVADCEFATKRHKGDSVMEAGRVLEQVKKDSIKFITLQFTDPSNDRVGPAPSRFGLQRYS